MKEDDVKIKVASPVFRKWDTIGKKQIVIRTEMVNDSEILTLKNIPKFRWKLLFWLWFKILKIRIWLSDKIRKNQV